MAERSGDRETGIVKPIMYHYVRPNAEGLPYFPYLRLSDFERQLEDFQSSYGFVSRDAFVGWVEGGPAPDGVLLTFDDGLRDHLEFVLPALRTRKLFGLFYVTSGPATTGSILDVHKVHLVVGKLGGTAVLNWLETNVPHLLGGENDGSADSHYVAQTADNATKFVKSLFNWKIERADKRAVLDALLDHAFAGRPPSWQDLYLDEQDMRELIDAGFGVGPHGHTHEVTSRLSPQQQREEVDLSCAFVDRVGGSRQWGYCYPFGSQSSFSQETEKAVAEAGCPFAFAVEAKDIVMPIARTSRYALPRHDCNAFPHGTVSYTQAASSPPRASLQQGHSESTLDSIRRTEGSA
jgi:peptidoglycan/xylan/chitin deacetylase (PgdA/CDA1 family)